MNEKKVPAIRFQGFTDDWEQCKLGDVANRYDNLRIPVASNLRVPGTTPYYGANGIQDYVDGFTHEGEFVLVAEDGANDLKNYPVQFVNGRIWVNNHAHVLQAKENCCDNKFLAYAINQSDIESLLVGGGRAKLNANIMMAMEILHPDNTEQKKIGTYFAHLDNLIALHQRKLTKLHLLKKSMLTKMFPKDGARVPEIRFQGFHDDWKLHPLNELAVFGGGHTPSMADEANYKKDGICWVTSQDVKTDYLFDTRTKLSDKGASELKLYPDGTIIMVTRSGILRHTLPIALLKIPATVNQDIRTISVGLSCSSTWLMHYLKVHERELLLNYGKVGTTVESIDFSKLKTMDLLVPTMDEQEKIGAYFSRMDDLIAIHQHNIAKWQHIKQAMLSKLFV